MSKRQIEDTHGCVHDEAHLIGCYHHWGDLDGGRRRGCRFLPLLPKLASIKKSVSSSFSSVLVQQKNIFQNNKIQSEKSQINPPTSSEL
jgi:hypothetical protein